METRKWKVFLRMNGETIVDTDQDILTEFKVMVEYLKWIGVDYSMAVQVEAGRAEHPPVRMRGSQETDTSIG